MSRPTAIITPYPVFNAALAGFLRHNAWPKKVMELDEGFAGIEPERIHSGFDSVIILAHEIVNGRLLDIGSVWAMYLAARHTVFLIDFEKENDLTANPIIINTMQGGLQRLAGWQWKDVPIRKGVLGDGSYFAALKGMFRAHGHDGFLGELAKFTTYLLAGLEFIEDLQKEEEGWTQYLEPALTFLENVLSIYGSYEELMAFLPHKALIARIKQAVETMACWREDLKARKIDALGAYAQVAGALDDLEKDVIKLRNMLEQ